LAEEWEAQRAENEDVGDILGGEQGPRPVEGEEPAKKGLRRFVRRPRRSADAPRPRRPWLGGRAQLAVIIAGIIILGAIVFALFTQAPSSPPPAAGVAEATVGSIKSAVTLDGVVVREPTEEVTAPISGVLTELSVRPGDAVNAGDDLATVTIPASTPTPSPTPTPTPTATPTGITESVTAPIAGTIGRLQVTKGQTVETGQGIVTIIPSRYDAIAQVPQDQLYRFYSQPLSIQAAISHQDSPIDCTFLSIGGNLPGSGATRVLQNEVDLRCQLPDGTAVFPGVPAKVVAVTAQVDDAITLPVQAVEQHGNTGIIWLVEKGKAPVRKEVTLGINDGRRIQIVTGLFAGQRVLNPARAPSPS
jgi:multidrug efflux pump subunit AcrA (membrane-fusion protein)